jgi:hypothetical protein
MTLSESSEEIEFKKKNHVGEIPARTFSGKVLQKKETSNQNSIHLSSHLILIGIQKSFLKLILLNSLRVNTLESLFLQKKSFQKGILFIFLKSPKCKPHGVQESRVLDSLQKIRKNFCRQMNVTHVLNLSKEFKFVSTKPGLFYFNLK